MTLRSRLKAAKKRNKAMAIGYQEEYRDCGCLSPIVELKKQLVGYCPKHGNGRKTIYRDHKLLPGMNQAPTSADIRRMVLQKLQGFPIRQAIRDAIRANKRKPQPPVVEQRSLFE
jgi:hypothetical protein